MTSENKKPGDEANATGALEVIIPQAPDWAEIPARWEAQRAKARAPLKADRKTQQTAAGGF